MQTKIRRCFKLTTTRMDSYTTEEEHERAPHAAFNGTQHIHYGDALHMKALPLPFVNLGATNGSSTLPPLCQL